MHLNGFLNMHIVVLRSSSVTIVLRIKIVITHFQFGTTGHFLFVAGRHLSFGVVSSRNGILVSLNEFSNHVPQHLLFLVGLRWHLWSKILEIIFRLFNFGFNFFDNFWQTMFDMCKKNFGQFIC